MSGQHADHIIGFTRQRGGQRITVLAGRHFAKLTDGGRNWPTAWSAQLANARMPSGTELLAGRPLSKAADIGALLTDLPVAIIAQSS